MSGDSSQSLDSPPEISEGGDRLESFVIESPASEPIDRSRSKARRDSFEIHDGRSRRDSLFPTMIRNFAPLNDVSRTMSRPVPVNLSQIEALYQLRVRILEGYLFVFQIRLAYVCMCFAIIGGSLALTVCSQGFFSVAYSDRDSKDVLVAFFAVPAVFAAMVFVVGEFIEVFRDITWHKHNPLVRCRSLFLVLMWIIGIREHSHRVSQFGIVLSILLLDVYPLVVAVYSWHESGWGIGPVLRSLTRHTMLALRIVCIFLAVSKVIVKASGHWHKVTDSQRHFKDHPLKSYFLPQSTEYTSDRALSRLPSIIFNDAHLDEGHYGKRARWALIYMFLSGVASFLTGWLISGTVPWQLWLGLWIQVVFLLSILNLTRLVFPHSYRATYAVLIFAYVLVTTSSICVAAFEQTGADDSGIRLEGAPSGPAYSPMVGFRLCHERWGNGAGNNVRLNIFDFLVMADSVYANNCEGGGSVHEKILHSVQGTVLEDFKLVECQDWKKLSRWAVIDFPNVSKRVLAIRGTQIRDEVVADAALLSSVAMLSALHPIVDVDSLLSLETVRWILASFNLQNWFHVRRDEPYLPHLEKARSLQEQARKDGVDLFVTGHSLGGAFAAIVGGRLGIHAVAFNAPGQGLMLNRYGLTNDAQLQMHLTSVIPDKDLVPRIDYQIGNLHHIPCAAECRNSKCYSQCHQLSVTICQLYSVCRDPRRRVLTGSLRDYCESIKIPV